MRTRTIFVLTLALLVLCTVPGAANAGPELPPFEPIPLTAPLTSLAAPDAGAEIREVYLSPTADAFIASQYPYDREKFGKDDVLYVGAYPDLGNLYSLMSYRWQIPVNLIGIEEAFLLYGVGDGDGPDMNVRVMIGPGDTFDESNISWFPYGGNLVDTPYTGVLGESGYWWGIDITGLIKSHPDAITLGLRPNPPQTGYWKGSNSREADPELAPQLFIRYRVDVLPPLGSWDPIKEWTNADSSAKFNCIEQPNPSAGSITEVEIRIAGEGWFSAYAPPFFQNLAGETVELRGRCKDYVGNMSGWIYAGPTKVYGRDLSGQVSDHRGRGLIGINPHFQPDPWYTNVSVTQPQFTARLKNFYELTASLSTSGYGTWGTEIVNLNLSPFKLYIPPLDNLMEVEGSGNNRMHWEPMDGNGWVQYAQMAHAGSALEFLRATGSKATKIRFCSKSTYDLSELNQPTLGFHYLFISDWSNKMRVIAGWEAAGGTFQPMQTVEQGEQVRGDWRYSWVNLADFRNIQGRPCFEISSDDSQYFSSVVLDSISLGSTRSNLTVRVHPPAALPTPGQPYTIDMVVTNHSPYPAHATLGLTPEGGSEQTWLVPPLASGQSYTQQVELIAPAEGESAHYSVRVGKTEIDDTPDDNITTFAILHNGVPLFHPFVIR